VRGWAKVLVWFVILLACAGVGAVLASRSNPFPPGVRASSPTPSAPEEEPTRWRLTLTSRTRHVYRVGGSCTSDWRMAARIRVAPRGAVTGTGVARLRPGARCDFETAQVQAVQVVVRIAGSRIGDRLRLVFRVDEVAPAGSQDLGGFVEALPAMRFSIRERGGASTGGPTQVRDEDGESHVAHSSLRLLR
jgi:hypothetical protein